MTLGEMIDAVYHEIRSVENYEQRPIVDMINYWNRYLHQQFLFDETLVSEDMTWSTSDASKKDVSAALTNWRGEPKWVESGDEKWERRSIGEIYSRRLDDDEYFDGKFCYAIQGIYMLTVSDVADATTVTVVHFKYPPALSDYTDTPLFPTAFHDMLVDKVVSAIWSDVRAQDSRAWARKQRTPEEQNAEQRFFEKWNKLMRLQSKDRQVTHVMEMTPVMKAVADRQWARR